MVKPANNELSFLNLRYVWHIFTVALVVFWVMSPSKTGAQAKIGQFNVTVSIDQYVIRLDIAMNKSHFMNTFHRASQFRQIKPVRVMKKNNSVKCRANSQNLQYWTLKIRLSPGQRLVKNLELHEQRHEITTRYVIHHEIEIILILQTKEWKYE